MGAFRDVVLLWSRSLSVIKLYHAQSAKAIVSCTRWCYVVLVSNNGLTVIDKVRMEQVLIPNYQAEK